MPKRSYEDFERAIAEFQVAPTPAMLQELIVETISVDADDVDENMADFTRSRIELAYRTGNVQMHVRHLYDVLAILERELAGSK